MDLGAFVRVIENVPAARAHSDRARMRVRLRQYAV